MDEVTAGVKAELRALEPILHRAPPGSGREVFEDVLADEFFEVGASGRVYGREQVLGVVVERYRSGAEADGAEWPVDDFAVQRIADRVYLVTYRLRQVERVTWRATLWRRDDRGWRAVYHQGTVVAEGD